MTPTNQFLLGALTILLIAGLVVIIYGATR
jgi:hypothetical protein